jgi:hypothetical protein
MSKTIIPAKTLAVVWLLDSGSSPLSNGKNAAATPEALLERRFRDIHVAVQHGAALPGHFKSALMGRRPSDPGW